MLPLRKSCQAGPPSYDYIPEAHCPRAQTLLRPEGNNRNYNYVTYTLIYYL
jgi:hypothetical protein